MMNSSNNFGPITRLSSGSLCCRSAASVVDVSVIGPASVRSSITSVDPWDRAALHVVLTLTHERSVDNTTPRVKVRFAL